MPSGPLANVLVGERELTRASVFPLSAEDVKHVVENLHAQILGPSTPAAVVAQEYLSVAMPELHFALGAAVEIVRQWLAGHGVDVNGSHEIYLGDFLLRFIGPCRS
jgi:hypothetical protein